MATQLISLLLLMAGDIEENPGPGDEPYRFTTKNVLRQLEVVVDWKSLGIELDINSAKLNEIDSNNRGRVGDCKRDMVDFWMASDTTASWNKLAQALDSVSQNVRAKEVRALGRQEAANPMAPPPQASRVTAPPPSVKAPTLSVKAPPPSVKAPPPPRDVLHEDHCTQLFRLTKKAADKWRVIGRELGFGEELDKIVRELGRHGDEDYYEAMLKRWLDWAPPNHSYPTLSALVAAIRAAGKERLANELECEGKKLFCASGSAASDGPEEEPRPPYMGSQQTTPTDPSKVLQQHYSTLVDTIQDPGGLADRLYSEGVIARNVKEKVEACPIPRDKTRALVSAVQQNVGADPGSFQTFIDVLKKDKSNAKLVSMLEGCDGNGGRGGGGGGARDGDAEEEGGGGGRDVARGGGRDVARGGGGAAKDDFSAVSAVPLGEDDLVDVMEEVMDMASKWRPLGLALRLRAAELDTISSKNHTDPTESLRDMLLAWLQQRYDTTRFGQPSWRVLCQAIHKQVGGNNPRLAKEIAGLHLQARLTNH